MKKARATSADLRAVVEHCLPKLTVLWMALDTYGNPKTAEALGEVIKHLQDAVPSRRRTPGPLEFIVDKTFTVARSQVARLLAMSLGDGTNGAYKIVDSRRPPRFVFCSDRKRTLGELDYPLNAGGSLSVVRRDLNPDCRQLNLKCIGEGLNVMAMYYPRHFTDFLNADADEVTADVFLQCCLFGELLCG